MAGAAADHGTDRRPARRLVRILSERLRRSEVAPRHGIEGGQPDARRRLTAPGDPIADRTRHEPQPDRQLHLGRGGSHPRHLQAGKYRDVILPLTVLRRLDCVLAPTKRRVLAVQARYAGKIDNLDPQLRRASGFAFYNTSRYDFEKLLADAPHIAQKSSLITVPTICEQDEMSRAMRSESEEVEVLIAKIREAIGQLREFRTALISAAVTGKIDVRDVAQKRHGRRRTARLAGAGRARPQVERAGEGPLRFDVVLPARREVLVDEPLELAPDPVDVGRLERRDGRRRC